MFNIRAARFDYGDFIGFRAIDGDYICTELKMEKREPHTYYAPIMQIDMTAAQVLMDNLWDCGIRPTEGKGSAGALKATEDHLKDMREIAFGFLNKVKEGL